MSEVDTDREKCALIASIIRNQERPILRYVVVKQLAEEPWTMWFFNSQDTGADKVWYPLMLDAELFTSKDAPTALCAQFSERNGHSPYIYFFQEVRGVEAGEPYPV